MQTATVEYQVATYSGEVKVTCDENDENDVIIAMAKRQLVRESGGVALPFGYQRFTVVNRQYEAA